MNYLNARTTMSILALASASLGALHLSASSSSADDGASVYPTGIDAAFAGYPVALGMDSEVSVSPDGSTRFVIWSPAAKEARVNVYPTDRNSAPTMTIGMQPAKDGTWVANVPIDLTGLFYTFSINDGNRWLQETPGIWAKAVGTNGERAAIIDFASTDPDGWADDHGPALSAITDAVLYEMHHRDFSIHPSSGIVNKGKFLALTEAGTSTPSGQATGIDHLKELGVTHVHILPSYDFNSVDEANLPSNSYNWGYDPLNYNAPEGSYSTNPADPAARVREMKQMVKALHDAGIGVVMDVVYNHTAQNDDSNFSLIAPGYFYRHNPDGSYSDASGCGNETASDRPMVSDYIVNSVKHWAKEYHIDGFRFDLMAIHDVNTMNRIAAELKEINPDIFVYGEGWTAGSSPLPADQRALKDNVAKMPQVAVFSDDLRDAVKGHYSDAADRGFATGKPGNEETVKMGIVAATPHPQVDFSRCNNSKAPYAASPTQVINYVSCHDDLTLTDKLEKSMPGSSIADRQRAAKLAQTIVLTSQGTPFIAAGEEVFRDKKGVHNSYKSPDSINAIDWEQKALYRDLFDYYRGLIQLRKDHPAFRMTSADDIAANLKFDRLPAGTSNLISYSLLNHANGDSWREIKLVFNGADTPQTVTIPRANWIVIARDGSINPEGMGTLRGGRISVEPRSALILARP